MIKIYNEESSEKSQGLNSSYEFFKKGGCLL